MDGQDYDFAGWVTKNDIRCGDGVTIKKDAFAHQDTTDVPLVWDHNHKEIGNVLGHVELQNKNEGVYGYGYFNESPDAIHAKELIRHGDIVSMSIGANRIKKSGSNVVHGRIYEVSLVLAGANPGALIESVVSHSDVGENEEEAAVIYTGNLIHSDDDVVEKESKEKTPKEGKKNMGDENKTVGDVMGTLNEDQELAVQTLIANIIDEYEDQIEQSDYKNEEGDQLKHNVFNDYEGGMTLQHSEQIEILDDARELGSLKEAFIEHGINNIEVLFPEAKNAPGTPFTQMPWKTAGREILASTKKSPFAKVKTIVMDLTEDEARAKGYIKGKEKLEQIFDIMHRETDAQTVYKKQAIDRDDLIDITDFDVVGFLRDEMRVMLEEELGRAILVGDGRAVSADDKIKETKIRPIINDDDLYVIKRDVTGVPGVIEGVIKALSDYDGTGRPTMYVNPGVLADLKLLKANDGRYLFGDIPSAEAIATRLGVEKIVETTLVTDKIVLVNLQDYIVGANKGGEVTTFDDFDIDFNKHKYLIETRVSGALVKPKSAIVLTVKDTPAAGEEGN